MKIVEYFDIEKQKKIKRNTTLYDLTKSKIIK